mgnify:CR=1 FL=1
MITDNYIALDITLYSTISAFPDPCSNSAEKNLKISLSATHLSSNPQNELYRKQGGGFMNRRPDLLEKTGLSNMFISTTAGNMIMGLEELSQSTCI